MIMRRIRRERRSEGGVGERRRGGGEEGEKFGQGSDGEIEELVSVLTRPLREWPAFNLTAAGWAI